LRSDAVASAAVAAAVLLAYLNAMAGPFQFDDYNVIVHNPSVHSVSGWLDSMPGIRPLLKLSYTLNWAIDPGPFGFHAVNVALHTANALLVYRLLRVLRVGHSNIAWAALAGALLFALHPVQTEAVTYISGRSVSLMALFYLGSVSAWVHADRTNAALRWRMLSLAFFAAALLLKETAVTLPLALLLLDATRSAQPLTTKQLLRRQGWHVTILACGLLAMGASSTYRHLLEVSLSARGVIDNLLTQANAVWYLAGQLVLPWRMNADPDLPVVTAFTPLAVMQALAIAALLAAGFYSLRRRPWLAFAVLWFFVHLLPTNSLLPRLDVANDRQVYLPSIGVFFAAGIGVEYLLTRGRRRWMIGAAAVLLVLGLGFATAQRNRVYGSEVTFWEDAARKSPSKPRVANNLGYVYQQAGRLDEARAAYLRAIALDPGYWKARINLDALEASLPH
jgi:protein O-mannosyl-transferase